MTQEVKLLEDLLSFDENDKLLAYSNKYNKLGFLPAGMLSNSSGYACRRWNLNNASPVGEAVGDIDYLRNLPAILGLGCYLVERNHGRRKLDPTNHYKLATGEAAALDGSMGHYMWGWGTPWFYSWWVEGNYYYEAASLKPILGRLNYPIPVGSISAIGGSIVDRDTEELVSLISDDPRYRGGNNDVSKDGEFNTMLGRTASMISAATCSTYARKNGEGWDAMFYGHAAIANALSRIIFGTRDLQTAFNPNKDTNGLHQGGLGQGVTNAGAWWADNFQSYGFLPTDVGVDLGDSCGVAPYDVLGSEGQVLQTVEVPVFFGYKNMYGYQNKWEVKKLFSMNADTSGDVYVTPKFYSDFNWTLAGMKKVATLAAGSDYISQISMQNLCHTPTVLGGSSGTYYADRSYSTVTSGLRVSAVGGNASYGLIAGPECLAATNASSAVYAHSGSPLCETASDWDTTPILVV
jgi:hypothetical protein